jgi:hypothetical protein
MAGEMEILFSLAGRVHTLLRRESSRIIDVEWMCIDGAYAREILKLVDASESDELQKLADRIREVHPALLKTETKTTPVSVSNDRKYMNTLR